MDCPECGYIMDAFDRECPRCHGQGLAPAAPPPTPPPAKPLMPTFAALTAAKPAPVAPAGPPANLPHFFAYSHCFYRVYVVGNELWFVEAGPLHPGLVDTVRRARAQLANTNATMAALMVSRTAAVSAASLGLAGGVGLGLVVGGVQVLQAREGDKLIGKRAEVLDAMNRDELRAQAEAKNGVIVDATNTSRVMLRPSKQWSMNDSPLVFGYFQFQHQSGGKTRKYKMTLATEDDAKDAVREFGRVVGAANIENRF